MKRASLLAALFALFLTLESLSTGFAQLTTFTYQGRVTDNGTDFTGTGQFQFALVSNANHPATATANAPVNDQITGYTVVDPGYGYATAPTVTITGGGGTGATATAAISSSGEVVQLAPVNTGSGYTSAPTVTIASPPPAYTTYWSNDDTSVAGSEPTAAVLVGVTNGLFTVVLGSTAVANMAAMPASLFATCTNLQLLIWFSDGVNGFAALNPAQPLTPAPYAASAIFANTASNLTGIVPVGQLSGTVPLAQLPSTVLTNNQTGVTLSNVTVGGNLTLSAAPATIYSGANPLFHYDGSGNFFAGALAGNPANDRGSDNTAIGDYAFFSNSNGCYNTVVGYGALYFNTNGSFNAAYGLYALNSNTGGYDNTAIGNFALNSITGGYGNIALGYEAGYNLAGNNNICIGNLGAAGDYNTIRLGTPGVQTNTFIAGIINGNGGGLTNLNAAQLSGGAIPLAVENPAVVTNNATGVTLSGSFSGNGGGLTNLSAAQLSGGTIPLAVENPAVITNNETSVTLNGSFTGNGSALTNLQLSAVGPAGTFSLLPDYFAPPITLTGFAPSITYGAAPASVAVADVNGDGKLDLIVANNPMGGGDGTLTVLTNNGSGVFGVNTNLDLGFNAFPACVVAADINGDGKVDLITVEDNMLVVFTNNGNGVFVCNTTLTVGGLLSTLNCVAAADVNGDGKPDLISANTYSDNNTLTVFTNNGSGVFGSNATLTVGSEPAWVVAVTNVNGKGLMALISANSGTNTLTVLTNNGSGVFGSNATLTVGSGPVCVVAADVNGDGRPDLICANSNTNTLTVLTNNGSGVFGYHATLTVGSAPHSVAMADVNGDGKPDLISANYSAATLTVLTNNGGGGFGYNATLHVGNQPACVVAADVNSDGKPDLVCADFGDNTLTVLLGFSQAVAVTNAVSFTDSANSFNGSFTGWFYGLFTGDGSGLTGLNAANLASGTVPLARLPSAVVTNRETGVTLSGSFTGSFTGNGSGLTNVVNAGTLGGSSGTVFTLVQSGQAVIPASATVQTNYTVTFPTAFTSVPQIIVSISNDPGFPDYTDTFAVSVSSNSVSAFRVNIVRVDSATGWGQQPRLNWLAWQ
jgi:hypothetical protein